MSDHSLFLLRALSDRDLQKRLVRELQQQLAALSVERDVLASSNASLTEEVVGWRQDRDKWQRQAEHWNSTAGVKDAMINRLRAELESQPRLQRVTPEAMAELEGRDNATIVTCDHDAAWVYRWSRKTRWTANRRPATRPTWGWFIDLSTIPEVQQ